MEYNGEVCYERFREILTALGEDVKNASKEDIINKFVNKIKALSQEVGITMTIKDYGVKEEDLESLADKAMEDPCKPGNPREVTKEDFIRLYREAM
jgi:alcohol dehydrogenase